MDPKANYLQVEGQGVSPPGVTLVSVKAGMGEAHPEILSGDFRELAVHVCQCWDGEIKLPLQTQINGQPRWNDQGIDLLYDLQPIMQGHRCDQAEDLEEAGGVWRPVAIKVPNSFYRSLLDHSAAVGLNMSAGAAVDRSDLESATEVGLESYVPVIKTYSIAPMEGISRQQRRAQERAARKLQASASRAAPAAASRSARSRSGRRRG